MNKRDARRFKYFVSVWLVFSLLAAGGIATRSASGFPFSTMLDSSGREWHVDACNADDHVGSSVFHYNKNTKDLFVNGKILRPGSAVEDVLLLRQSDCEADVRLAGLRGFSVLASGVGDLNSFLSQHSSWTGGDVAIVSPRVTVQEYGSGSYLGGGGTESTVSISQSKLDAGIEVAYEPRLSGDSGFLQRDDILGSADIGSYSCDFQFKTGARYHDGNTIFEYFVRDDDGDTYINDLWWSRVQSKYTSGKLNADAPYFTTTGGPYDLYAVKTYKCNYPIGLATKYAWADMLTSLTIAPVPVQATPVPTQAPVVTVSPPPTLPPAQPISTNCEPTVSGTSIDGVTGTSAFSVTRAQGKGVTVGVKYSSACALTMAGFSAVNSGSETGNVLAVPPPAIGGFYTATIYSEALRTGTNQIMAYWVINGEVYKKQIGTVQVSSASTGPVGDSDGDGIRDEDDNCPNTRNGGQTDTDGDGVGDVCDSSPGSPGGGPATAVVGWAIQSGKCVYVTSGAKYNYETACIDALNAGASTGVGNGSGDNATECPRLDFDVDEAPPRSKTWEYEYNEDKTCIIGRSLEDAPVYRIGLPRVPSVDRFNLKLFIGAFGMMGLLGIVPSAVLFRRK